VRVACRPGLFDLRSHSVVIRRDDETDRVFIWPQSAMQDRVRYDLSDGEPGILESAC
jgi:hypothetical protein